MSDSMSRKSKQIEEIDLDLSENANNRIENIRIENNRIENDKKENNWIGNNIIENNRIENNRKDNNRIENNRKENNRMENNRKEIIRMENNRIENNRIENNRMENNRIENNRIENNRKDINRMENNRLENNRIENNRIDNNRIDMNRMENNRIGNNRMENNRLDNNRIDMNRMENNRIGINRIENNRIGINRIENNRMEINRIENNRIDNNRIGNNRKEINRIENNRMENNRIDNNRKDNNRLENNRIENNRLENNRIENNRIEKNRMENNRMENNRIENNRIEKNRMENNRIDNNRIEIRFGNNRIENNRIENNRIEKKRIEDVRIEDDKIDKPLIGQTKEEMQKFDELDQKINISAIQNKENNIDIDESKSIPLIERKESTDTLFSAHKNIKEVKNEDFKILKIIGRGSFGKVCLVEYLPTHEIYAMKSLKKDLLIQEEKIENTLLEKEILQTMNHPFIINLIFCFQTEQRINFVMPFIPGGELFQHLKNLKHFGELKVKFYAAQMAIAIQYLHDMGYVYRDLKPENILIDEKGYLRLTDFGLAKKLKKGEKTDSFCGTPEYVAPEIINGKGYDENVDWWSLGIVIYEMICGIPPFYVQDLDKMYKLIKTEKIRFDKKFLISKDAKDLILKLLEKDVEKRLCYHEGIEEIKKHPFFKSIDFDALLRKEIDPPYIPIVRNSTDVRNFDELFTNETLEMSNIAPKNLVLVKENQYKFEKFAH